MVGLLILLDCRKDLCLQLLPGWRLNRAGCWLGDRRDRCAWIAAFVVVINGFVVVVINGFIGILSNCRIILKL